MTTCEVKAAGTAQCRLLIFEGIMGSGKTTATREFAKRILAAGQDVVTYTEGADPHPVRASDDLPDFFQPWNHASPEELAKNVRTKWSSYVRQRLADERFTIMDGQLFHGDLTHLFLMGMNLRDLKVHVRELMAILAPLKPVIVYFRPQDVGQAVRAICDARGATWREYQLNWKLKSPYAAHGGLLGISGLVDLYRDYRMMTDSLYEDLECSRISVDPTQGDWPTIYGEVADVLSNVGVAGRVAASDPTRPQLR